MSATPAPERPSTLVSLHSAAVGLQSASLPQGYRKPDFVVSEQVVVAGNASEGSITLFAQTHFIEGTQWDSRQLMAVGEFQAAILQEFARRQTKCIFCEGLCDDLHKEPSPEFYEKRRVHLRALFPNGVEDCYSAEQLKALAMWGATTVWWAINPEVSLRATTDDQFEEDTRRMARNVSLSKSQSKSRIMLERELRAIQSVVEYLQKNPAAEVALLYGAAHQFGARHFEGYEISPVLTRIDFRAGSPEVQPLLWLSKPLSAEEQKPLIEEAECISSHAFRGLADPALFATAYRKLYVNLRFDTAESVLGSLRMALMTLNLLGSEEERMVERDFAQRSGPFAETFPKRELPWEAIPTMSAFEVAKLLIKEHHPPTQHEIVRVASSILSYCFASIQTERAQVLAVGKIVPMNVGVEPGGVDGFIEGMKGSARSEEVRGMIEAHRSRFRRLVEENHVDPYLLECIPSAPPAEISRLLRMQPNGASQLAILEKAEELRGRDVGSMFTTAIRCRALEKVRRPADMSPQELFDKLAAVDPTPEYRQVLENLFRDSRGPFAPGVAESRSLPQLFKRRILSVFQTLGKFIRKDL